MEIWIGILAIMFFITMLSTPITEGDGWRKITLQSIILTNITISLAILN